MARVKAVREAEKRLKGDLLTALLQDNITPRDAILWVQSMGMDLDLAHSALRFAWDSPDPPSMRRLETLVNGEVSRRGAKVLVETMGSEIACICQVSRSPGRPEEALALANGVVESASQEFPQIAMRCGIGRPALDVPMWRDSFRQAGQALEMARRLCLAKPSYFPDLSVYRLLFQLEHHPDLKNFKEEILGSLLAYEGSGDLVKTLEVYFEHNGNLSQAAEALYIHRNTLIYRMERIAEITGLDLDKTETRLAVQLALRIHRMMVG
jgi:purine catabolism regulator